jgi:DNA-binding response OmpR family regulator
MSTRCILVVEEDEATRTFLAGNLAADGYEVTVAGTRADALSLLAARRPDLVIADINGQTLGLLDAIRDGGGLADEIDPGTPMIVLTGRADELARVRYFDRGSDDVVPKPFSYPELRGRVRALLRRSQPPHGRQTTRIGRLRIDHAARQVHVGDTPVHVSAKEYALLAHLATAPTCVFTKDELLRDVWGFRSPGATRTLDSHACRLRRKLGDGMVVNVWGVGYRLIDGPLHQEEGRSLGGSTA